MMNIEQFREVDARMRSQRPKPFLLIPPDAPASEQALVQVEQSIAAVLPDTYRDFLREFGGGSFGLTNICSADASSDFYLPRKQEEVSSYLPTQLLAVSDDFAGGLYVLRVAEGRAQDPVLYWNGDGGLSPTEFANVLEFVSRYAYHSA